MGNLKKNRFSYKKISIWAVIASISGAGASSVSIQYEHNKLFNNPRGTKEVSVHEQ